MVDIVKLTQNKMEHWYRHLANVFNYVKRQKRKNKIQNLKNSQFVPIVIIHNAINNCFKNNNTITNQSIANKNNF